MIHINRLIKRLMNEVLDIAVIRYRKWRIILLAVVICVTLLSIQSIMQSSELFRFLGVKDKVEETTSSRDICGVAEWKQSNKEIQFQSPRIFIAALLYNSADLFPHWSDELVRLIHALSLSSYDSSNIFVSIHASGKDATIEWISELKDQLIQLNVVHDIQANNNWDDHPSMQNLHRIDKLALLRNIAIRKLLEPNAPKFDQVLYLNDVIFCASGVVSLLHMSLDFDTDLICSTDYVFSDSRGKPSIEPLLYDTWVARDIRGHKLSSGFPHSTTDTTVIEGFRKQFPFKVASCWNGVVVIKADIFQERQILFRSSHFPFECRVSECELLARDLHHIQRSRIVMVPSIMVAYSILDYQRLVVYKNQLFDATSDMKDSLLWKQKLMESLNVNATPIDLECCPLRHNEKLMHWDDCFMERHWNMAQHLMDPKVLSKSVVDFRLTDIYDYWRNHSLSLTCLNPRTSHTFDKIDNIYQLFRNTNARYTPYRYISNLMSFWWQYPCANHTLMVVPPLDSARIEFKMSQYAAQFAKTGGLYVGVEVMALEAVSSNVINDIVKFNQQSCSWKNPLLLFALPETSPSIRNWENRNMERIRCPYDSSPALDGHFMVPLIRDKSYWISNCHYWPSPLYHSHRSCHQSINLKSSVVSNSQSICSQYLGYDEILVEGQSLSSWNIQDDTAFGIHHPVFRYSALNVRQQRDLRRELEQDTGSYLSLQVKSGSLAVYLISESKIATTLLYEIKPSQSISPISSSNSSGYFQRATYLQLRGRCQLVLATRSATWCEEGEGFGNRNKKNETKEEVLWKGDSNRLLGKLPTAGCFFLVLRAQSAALEVYAGNNPNGIVLPWAASRHRSICISNA